MHKVLIVDDDKLIREDIKQLIDWNSHGFEVAGEAPNGSDALELLQTMHIDLVVADIYMPVMDGIELIREARTRYPRLKFLVISNYDDFAYVKEAMKLGASDYILKYEIDSENLVALLDKFKQEAAEEERKRNDLSQMAEIGEKGRAYLIEQFWKQLLHMPFEGDSLFHEAERLGINIREGSFILLLVDVAREDTALPAEEDEQGRMALPEVPGCIKEVLQEVRAAYVVPLTEERTAVILHLTEKSGAYLHSVSTRTANEIRIKVSRQLKLEAAVSIGNICFSVSELPAGFTRVRQIAKDRFYRGFGITINPVSFVDYTFELQEQPMNEFKKGILREIGSGRQEAAAEKAAKLFEHVRNQRYYPELVYNYFIDLLINISGLMKEKHMEAVRQYDIHTVSLRNFRYFSTLKKMEHYLQGLIGHVSTGSDGFPVQVKREEVRKAIDYIHRCYREELSLNGAAEYVGLSKNYFCRLFKEETGENFIDYVNKVRVEKAKYFIMNTNAKTTEIAFKVGIRDYRYFTKIFKQVTGLRPNDYKKGVLPAG